MMDFLKLTKLAFSRVQQMEPDFPELAKLTFSRVQ
jgi:hypothetical protein